MTQLLALQQRNFGYVWTYITFFWGMSWRIFAVAMFSAVSVGVILGVMSNMQSWPPRSIEIIAPMIGLPITLAVMGWVVYLQIRDFLKSKQS